MSESFLGLRIGAEARLLSLAEILGADSPAFAVREVIAGGMGLCGKIQHIESGSLYALKTIHKEALESNAGYSRFVEEAKIWVTLSTNGGIVPAYGIVRINEVPVVCAKWMEGGSLRQSLPHRSPEFFYGGIDRLVRALAWAWATYAVIHRDLKPENILFDGQGWPHVSDWGLAKSLLPIEGPLPTDERPARSRKALKLTAAGSFLGTILYSAPEQILDATSADNRADIYSLGCIMYEWETGIPPFVGATAEEIAYGHLTRKPRRPAGWLNRSQLGAERVILKCLEKRRENRFESYEELREALGAAARRRNIIWNAIPIAQGELLPRIGWNQIRDFLREDGSVTHSADHRYALVEQDRLRPYLVEAETLMAVGEFERAAKILEHSFVSSLIQAVPDDLFCQYIAVNYGNCLASLGRTQEAIEAYRSIAAAKGKPPEFYVNLPLNLLRVGRAADAEAEAREGVKLFPEDTDILGNLTIILNSEAKYEEALETAKRRLQLGKDVHSLEEMAAALSGVATRSRDRNWPEAFAFPSERSEVSKSDLHDRQVLVGKNLVQR